MKAFRSLIAIVSIALSLTIAPIAAFALEGNADEGDLTAGVIVQNEPTLPASSTWGTCSWQISADGVLTVGTGTGIDTGGNCPWNAYAGVIKSVDMSAAITAPADCSSLFHNCSKVESINLSGLNTTATTTMRYMFGYCEALESVTGIGDNFSTSNVTSMEGMFAGCEKLGSLDLKSFNTVKVTNMEQMFFGCLELATLDVSSFNTTNVTNYVDMFSYCKTLASLDISSFNMDAATKIESMLNECSNLSTLKLGEHMKFQAIDDGNQGATSVTRLPYPPINNTYTGHWIRETDGTELTPWQFSYNTDRGEEKVGTVDHLSSVALVGEWTWQKQDPQLRMAYNFSNSYDGFGYKDEELYRVPEESYQLIYSKTDAKFLYDSLGEWEGNCFGMCSTSQLLNTTSSGVNITDFYGNAALLIQIWPHFTHYSKGYTLTRFIEAMQASQYHADVAEAEVFVGDRVDNKVFTLDDLANKVLYVKPPLT